MTEDYEKLGLLYLGRRRDVETATTIATPYLYDSRDLLTHGVIVGMTGSGKTGLGVVLMEEAAIDGIPVIAIDPKGDLANLLLTFPALAPSDFRPWIDENEAERKGLSPDGLAEQEARKWRDGLSAWGQSPDRITRLGDAVERVLFTPGSSAGRRLGLLRSFDPPPDAIRSAPDAYRERLSGTTAGLLALAGLDDEAAEEPARVLLSAILDHAWSSGKSLSLADLVHAVSTPPIERVGVMDIESFFPAKARFAFAMKLNSLLAGAGIVAWTEGEPLDVKSLLRSPSGKPRISILSIAHLGDRERMFFVTTLLSEIVAWMRSQTGSSSLRALLYLDEAMGYLPPVASPPSKGPMLTLLKQARAFGLGVVIATQNPVDLDYKALSNAGTWFIGRLQTERDRLRVLDALESAARSPGFDRADAARLVGGLGPRQFLAYNAHDAEPAVFETRWALSYLRGPLTSPQISALVARTSEASTISASPPASSTGSPDPVSGAAAATSVSKTRPALPPEIRQLFAPVRSASPIPGAAPVHLPALLGIADLSYVSPKHAVDLVWTLRAVTPFSDGPMPIDWARAGTFEIPTAQLSDAPPPGASFGVLCREAALPKSYPVWEKAFGRWAAQTQALSLFHSPSTGLVSRPGESRGELVARLSEHARQTRDQGVADLRQKHAPKLQAAADQIRNAEIAARLVEQSVEQQRVSASFGIGSSIVGALFGRKVLSAANVNRAGRAVRGAQQLSGGATKVEKARQTIERHREKLRILEAAVEADVAALDARVRAMSDDVVELAIKPRKGGVHVTLVSLVWMPFWATSDGRWVSA